MEAVRVKKPKAKKVKEKVAEIIDADQEENVATNEPTETSQPEPSSAPVEDEAPRVEANTIHHEDHEDIPAPQTVVEPLKFLPRTPLYHAVEESNHTLPTKSVELMAEAPAVLEGTKSAAQQEVAPATVAVRESPSKVTETVKPAYRVGERYRVVQRRASELVMEAPLYPSLAEKMRVVEPRPLSVSEMKVYFVNAEARALEAVIDQFIESNSTITFHHHPLYIYLTEYLKSLTEYEKCMCDFRHILKHYEESRDAVWRITDNRASEHGKCADHRQVSGEHHYRQCHLNKSALANVGKDLEDIRQFLYKTSFQHKCTAELARFQVECYLHDVIRSNPVTANLNENSSTVPRAECIKLSETSELRVCVAVIFAFHRMPVGSERFRDDIRMWLAGCVGTLLRFSTFYDQLFLLNHLLRSPSPVVLWASSFLQIMLPGTFSGNSCNNAFVKHFVVMLNCLFLPTKARDDFLSAFIINQLDSDSDSDVTWVVVDPDAEGQEMKTSTTLDVQENDLFHLLKQFPFDGLFSYLFGSDMVDLGPFLHVTEYEVLTLFAFCHDFLEILTRGLANPSLNKYTRFNKKVAQIIRELIIHCKEFWERLVEMKGPGDSAIGKLLIQFEELLLRGIRMLLLYGKIGTLQFLVGWPSRCLSPPNLWRAVVMLQTAPDVEVPYNVSVQHWKHQLSAVQTSLKLEERLQFLDETNAIYLLTALAGVVQNCDASMLDFVETVTMELFRISFLGPLRLTHSKTGRDLICSICLHHPSLISELTSYLRKNLQQLGSMAVYLFQEMPLKLWHPSRPDIEFVCEWLVKAPTIQDPAFLLAREILSNLNWGFAASGELCIRPSFQHYVAVAIVEAFIKFISYKHRRHLLYESLLRLSNMVTTGKSTPEQQFVGWCWEVLLELKLHRLSQISGSLNILRNNSVLDDDVPTLSRDSSLLSSLVAVEQRQPMACYVALMMTDVGHSTTGILDQGLDWLGVLIEHYLYVPTLQILETISPLFFANNQFVYLLQQDQFHHVINSLLQADATYLRMVKNLLVSEFPGTTLRTFANMLIHQLLHSGANLPLAIRMWTRVFTSLKNWNRTRETLYVLDQVVKFAFYAREFETVMAVLREAYEEYRQSKPVRGGTMTSLVSWMTSGSTPAFVMVDGAKLAETPWLGYAVLQVETESLAGLWRTLLTLLTGEKRRTFEEGLKKASQQLEMVMPAVTDLPVYRFAQLIISVDVQAEIFPLLCQEFFKLFLQRSDNHASIGDQFFLSLPGTRLLKPIKEKLRDVAEYYRKRATALEERTPKFFQDLQHAMRAFSFWMDEPKLHDPHLYLPALPVEYEPELLGTVLHSHFGPWVHFVDIQTVYQTMRAQAEHWLPFEVKAARKPTMSIISPIKAQDAPCPPPGTLSKTPPYVPVEQAYLIDPSKVLYTLRPDLTVVQDAAKSYVSRLSVHLNLDLDFLEYLTELNDNFDKEVRVFVPCHKGQCAGPAEIVMKFREFTRNEPVYRRYLVNREEWTRILTEEEKISLKPLVTSMIRFEKAVSHLVELSKSQSSGKVMEVGAILFYHILVFMSEETEQHHLTRKFFHSCVDVLGQYFIANQMSQCCPLLETCLNNQSAIPVLLPHFTPNIIPKELLMMYRRVQQSLQASNNDALMQLLSAFDIARWLKDPVVDVSSRMELLNCIAQGISQLGSTPSFQNYPLFEVYAQHMRAILQFRFPVHLMDVLRILLDLCEKNVLPSNGWLSCFFAVLDIGLQHDLDPLTSDTLAKQFTHIQKIGANGKLSVDLALVVVDFLTEKFRQKRLSTNSSRLYGLYPTWKMYVSAFSVLFMSFSTVLLPLQSNDVVLKITNLFASWISVMSISGEELLPFLQADVAEAGKMIASFRLLISAVAESNPKVLSRIWHWFYDTFIVPRAEGYILTAVGTELLELKWEKFVPDLQLTQHFVVVCENGPAEARTFLAGMIPQIPWRQTFSTVQIVESENRVVICVNLIKTLLFFATDSSFRPFEQGILHFIQETRSSDWGCVTATRLAQCVQTIASNPESMAAWTDTRIDDQTPLIRLLSLFTEFEANNLNSNQNTVEKRAMFLHIYGRAAVAWYTAHDHSILVPFAKDFLQKVEAVWLSAEPNLRYRGYVALSCEVFSLSNYVKDKKVATFLRGAILIWIAESPHSLLLVPMLTACCRCVVAMEQMVQYTEILIASYFRNVGQYDWNPLVYALETPELSIDEFVKEALSKQCFLTLNAYFIRSVQTTASEGSKRMELFRELVDWCKVRPLAENEAKVFLLWNQLLLITSLMENSADIVVEIRSFVETIFAFAEDKGGILSAIGVGKVSVLSRPFKIVARSLAVVASPLTPSTKTSGKSSTLANETRNAYEAMKSRKEYGNYGDVFSVVDGYVSSQGSLSWSNIRSLLGQLLEKLYKQHNFLISASDV